MTLMFRMADVDCITLEDSDDEPKMRQIIVRLDSNYFHVSNIFSDSVPILMI